MKKIIHRYKYGTPTCVQEIKDLKQMGVNKSEQEIIEGQYLMHAKAYKQKHPDVDVWEGLTVEEYCKKYPVKYNAEKGIWTNL